MNDDIQALLDRIAAGTHTGADLASLHRALLVGGRGNVVQVGKYNVHIGEGQDVRIGDTIYQGSDAAAIRVALRAVLDEAGWQRRFGVPFQAPPLPAHFVPRPEVTDALKACLLADTADRPGVLVVSAIHGLGGIGKSTLATALAHDPEVQARFTDGILWVTLGQQPELLPLLGGWIQALGDYEFHPTTVGAAATHLRTLLHNRATLLVVDDAWDATHVRPFVISSPHCRMLITTRRVDVADEFGAELHELDVMTPEQALTLLPTRLGRPLANSEQPEASRLAKAVGYLPLALELAAIRVRHGSNWAELCRALEAEIARLEVLDGPRGIRHGGICLEASLNLSLRALHAEDKRAWIAFVWLGVLPEDAVVAAPLGATLWDMTKAEAEELLELLWNDALVLSAPPVSMKDKQWPGYRLHDLMHDMARRMLTTAKPKGLGLRLPDAHSKLVERYRAKTKHGLWHTISDDAYIYPRLAYHLAKAGQWSSLHSLVTESKDNHQPWAEARHRMGGSYAGYLADLALAWTHFENEGEISPEAVGRQVHYALIKSSINTLAGNTPPKLLARLVANSVLGWTPAAALGYAIQIPYDSQRIRTLGTLAPYLSPELITETLTAAGKLSNEYQSAEVLQALAPRLPTDLLFRAWIMASEMKDRYCRNETLGALASHLPSAFLLEAWTAATKSGDTESRSELLRILAQHLPPDRLAVAWNSTNKFESKTSRSDILSILAPHLPQVVIAEVLDSARKTEGEEARTEILMGLAPRLPSELLAETLMAVQKTAREEDRARVLMVLAPRLPSEVIAETLILVGQIENEDLRTIALCALAPYLPTGLYSEALVICNAIRVTDYRAEALQALSRHCPSEQLGQILTAIHGIKDREICFKILQTLAPQLTPDLLVEELEAVRKWEKPYPRAKALRILALHLPSSQRQRMLTEAIRAARDILGPRHRAEVLRDLLRYLPSEQRSTVRTDALKAAREVEHWYSRAELIRTLAPYFPPESRRQMLAESWAAARNVDDDDLRAEALDALAEHLPSELLAEVWTATRGIGDEEERVSALRALTPYLPPALLVEAWDTEPGIDQIRPPDMTGRALATVSKVESEKDRTRCLRALVPHLSSELLPVALATVCKIQDEANRAEGLIALIPRLAPELPDEALAKVGEIESKDVRTRCLRALIPYLPSESLPAALAAVCEIQDEGNRAEGLIALMPRLTPELLAKALPAVRKIQDARRRAEALTSVAQHVATEQREDMLRWALNSAHLIEDDSSRAKILGALTPHLPSDLRRRALAEARTAMNKIQDAALYVSTLLASGLYSSEELSETMLVKAVTDTYKIRNEHQLAKVLRDLAPYLTQELLNKALTSARQIVSVDARTEALSVLAPYLSFPSRLSVLEEAWAEASKIPQGVDRTKTLSILIPLLPSGQRERRFLEILTEAHTNKSKDERTLILEILARSWERWIMEDRKSAYKIWSAVLHRLTTRSRREMLDSLVALMPAIVALGGDESASEIGQTIADVGRWWP